MLVLKMGKAGGANNVACNNCFQFKNCLWGDAAIDKVLEFDKWVVHRRPFCRGQNVMVAGQKSEGLCIVRSGCLKAYLINEEGELQVTGFYLPGELLCIDDIASGIYPYYVEALDVSSVCTISISAMMKIVVTHPDFVQQVLKKISRNACREHDIMAVLARMNPKQRLAWFLLDIASRVNPCYQAGECEFMFSMRRSDIASYLGLAAETVSRWLSEFQKQGLIAIRRRRISIKNYVKLSKLVNPPAATECFSVNKAAVL